MTTINDGGPAFPWEDMQNTSDCSRPHHGMTLRDWFAGQERIPHDIDLGFPVYEALAGKRPEGNLSTNPTGWFDWANRVSSAIKYARADAMIAQRNKEPT